MCVSILYVEYIQNSEDISWLSGRTCIRAEGLRFGVCTARVLPTYTNF